MTALKQEDEAENIQLEFDESVSRQQFSSSIRLL